LPKQVVLADVPPVVHFVQCEVVLLGLTPGVDTAAFPACFACPWEDAPVAAEAAFFCWPGAFALPCAGVAGWAAG
jgi:hypothetical protein